jgi:hypothetical protein
VKRQDADKAWPLAETLTGWYPRLKGLQILARRTRIACREVVIVAGRSPTLTFV